jgi:hypothetical protein
MYGPCPHYIDHLAPLCSLLGIPLFVTEEEDEASLKTFYPQIQTIRIPSIQLPERLIQDIDVFFICTPRILFDEIFFFTQKLHNKKIHTIWCPHGNSDKGHASTFMEGLNKEEIALVYGEKMIDFLKLKGSFNQLKKAIKVGNYRKLYYLKQKAFYDSLLHNQVLRKLPQAQKTVFYAPTWKDRENSSSFTHGLPHLIKNLPSDWNLIIKPHPHLLADHEEGNRKLIEQYEYHERVLFLKDFPPIFPLLDKADIYIGDLSSVGYDFLSFNRPMFFLNDQRRDPKNDLGLYLYRCGTQIVPEEYADLYEIIKKETPEDSLRFSNVRKEVDLYTFEPDISETILKQEIFSSYRYFPDKDLNFF